MPAQGSLTPAFLKDFLESDYNSEPVGGSAPKFPSETDLSRLTHKEGNPLRLTCPAQASPLPSFRCVLGVPSFIIILLSSDLIFRTNGKQ